MSNDELKAKYARIANDPSQLEMFKNDLIDGNIIPEAIDFDAEVQCHYYGAPAISGRDVDFGEGVKLVKVYDYITGIATVSRAAGATSYTIWLMDFKTGDIYGGTGSAAGTITLTLKPQNGFLGIVQCSSFDSGAYGILGSDMPNVSGLFKIAGRRNGILFVAKQGSSLLKANAMIHDEDNNRIRIYKYSCTYHGTYDDFAFNNANEYYLSTKLYKHVISSSNFNVPSFTVISTDSTNYTGNAYVSGNYPIRQLLKDCISASISTEHAATNKLAVGPGMLFSGGGGTNLELRFSYYNGSAFAGASLTICTTTDTLTDTVTPL